MGSTGEISSADKAAQSIAAGTSAVAKEQGELKGDEATQYRIVESEDKIGNLAWIDPKAESQGGYAASTLTEAFGKDEALKLSSLKAYDKYGKLLDLEGDLPKPVEAGTKGVYKIPLRLVGRQEDGKLVVIDRYIYLRTGKKELPTQEEIKSTLWYETQQIRALNGKLSAESGARATVLDKRIFDLAIDNPTFQFITKTVGEKEGEIKEEDLKKYEGEHKWVRLDPKGDSSQTKKAIGVQSASDNALFKELLKLPPKQEEVRTDVVQLLKQKDGKSQALGKLEELKADEKKSVLETQTKKATGEAKKFLEKLKTVDTAKLKDDQKIKETLEKLRKEYDDVRGEIVAAHFINDPEDSTKEVSLDLKEQEDALQKAINELNSKLSEAKVKPFLPVLPSHKKINPKAPPLPTSPAPPLPQPQSQQSSSVASSPAVAAAAAVPVNEKKTPTVQSAESVPPEPKESAPLPPQKSSIPPALEPPKGQAPKPPQVSTDEHKTGPQPAGSPLKSAQEKSTEKPLGAAAKHPAYLRGKGARPQKQEPSGGRKQEQVYKRQPTTPAKPGANKAPQGKFKGIFHKK